MGTEEGSIISTIGIATSILVNVVILTVGAVAGSVIPEHSSCTCEGGA